VASNSTVLKPAGVSGLSLNTSTQLFIDAPNGDFRLNPTLNLPSTLGADPIVIAALDARAKAFGVDVKWDGWVNDELKLTQTILDNIPGLNDGIDGNETVFTDIGTMTANNHEIIFNVVNGTWKTENNSPAKQEFHLNEKYYTWYNAIYDTYKNAKKANYERIRFGCSYLKQDQVFDNDWLTVAKITSDTNTVIYGKDQKVTLDGDLLVDFEGIVPAQGSFYDLVIAKTIVPQGSSALFDRVIFKGFTPDHYSIKVVNTPIGQSLRLTVSPLYCNCQGSGIN
jgi:hypothetical protein